MGSKINIYMLVGRAGPKGENCKIKEKNPKGNGGV